MRRNRVLIGIASLVTLLSGCIKLDMDIKIKSDEKIDGSAVVAFSDQILSLTGQTKKDFIKELMKDNSSVPKGAKSEVYDKDGYIGQKITFKDLPAADFGKVVNSASSGPAADTSDDLKLVKEKGTWKFTGTMDLAGGTTTGTSDTLPKALTNAFKVKIRVTFPGDIIKTDKSAKVKGRTVTWEPKSGTKAEMLAISKLS
jgi:hypothetical protein